LRQWKETSFHPEVSSKPSIDFEKI
jgi:hypothetical protein